MPPQDRRPGRGPGLAAGRHLLRQPQRPGRRACPRWSRQDLRGAQGRHHLRAEHRHWSPPQPMSQGRWFPTAITLPDGRARVVSGEVDRHRCTAQFPEIYSPTTQWTQHVSRAVAIRAGLGATWLATATRRQANSRRSAPCRRLFLSRTHPASPSSVSGMSFSASHRLTTKRRVILIAHDAVSRVLHSPLLHRTRLGVRWLSGSLAAVRRGENRRSGGRRSYA
jgi:hypothetical protein